MVGFGFSWFFFFFHLVTGLTAHFLPHSAIFLVALTFCSFSSYVLSEIPWQKNLFPTAQKAMTKWKHFAINLEKDSTGKTK